jgi:hypothetical protein
MALHPLGRRSQSDPRLRDRGRLRPCRDTGRLVLSVVPCYGQIVPGEKEVDQMTIALASFRRATRLVGC